MSDSSENCHCPIFPSAEECANQLMSVSTFVAVANNPTSSLSPASECANAPSERDVLFPSTNIRSDFAVPITTNLKSSIHGRSIRASPSSSNQRIGTGDDQFEIKVCIEQCHDLRRLLVPSRTNIHVPRDASSTAPANNLWLSYRFMNTVAQSEMLSEGATLDFPMLNTFRIQSSLPELVHYFHEKKNSLLKVHLCTQGEIFGTSYIDMRQLIIPPQHVGKGDFQVNAIGFEGRMIHHEYIVKPRGGIDGVLVEGEGEESQSILPRLTVRLCIDRDSASSDAYRTEMSGKNKRRSPTAVISLSTSSQTAKTICLDRASSPRQSDHYSIEYLEDKTKQLNSKEVELSKKEKDVLLELASLERKRCEWERWRHRQELECQEKLRQKEAIMLKAVEERVHVIEKERISALELSKNEYEKLETRLRKALTDVEAKERQLKHAEINLQNERKSKLAELELREKLMKEELKHSITIERAKVTAAVEQTVAAQTAASAATKKVNQLEIQIDQLREQHRATPEVALLHEVAELKGLLADKERRIEALKGEKNTVIAEKEQFRANVHKLARALRQEREKAVTKKKECNNQHVCLSYDKHQNAFALSGDQDEVQRILTDLSRISQGTTPPIKVCSHTSSASNNNMSPIPFPPPVHPITTKTSAQQQFPLAV